MGPWSRSGCLFDGSADEIEKWLSSAWAGDRIICVGNDWWANELPNNVFTEEEITRLELHEHALYDVASAWPDPEYKFNLVPEPESSPLACNGGRNKVLRNLTKGQYVREEAIKVAALDTGYFPVKAVGLGQVVLSRISWTRLELYPTYNGDIRKGIWAGDRFDIVPVDMVNSSWTDVSEEVAAEMNKIWQGKFGHRWIEWKVRSFFFLMHELYTYIRVGARSDGGSDLEHAYLVGSFAVVCLSQKAATMKFCPFQTWPQSLSVSLSTPSSFLSVGILGTAVLGIAHSESDIPAFDSSSS